MMRMVGINIFWDDEACVWVAISDEIGLALESESYDTLLQRIQVAAPEMAECNNVECKSLNILTQNRMIAYA